MCLCSLLCHPLWLGWGREHLCQKQGAGLSLAPFGSSVLLVAWGVGRCSLRTLCEYSTTRRADSDKDCELWPLGQQGACKGACQSHWLFSLPRAVGPWCFLRVSSHSSPPGVPQTSQTRPHQPQPPPVVLPAFPSRIFTPGGASLLTKQVQPCQSPGLATVLTGRKEIERQLWWLGWPWAWRQGLDFVAL